MSELVSTLLKERGIAKMDGRHGAWTRRVRWLILAVIPEGAEFGCGEKFREFAEVILGPPPHPNCWGAAFYGLARQGYLVDTGRSMKNYRASAHSRRVVLWQRPKTIKLETK